ncbi:MAG: hypothetical protein H6Q28_188 [Bacteroidetes bacterium]|jgi:hypothetical protein|nr:hypothetical protein [Bacteroidota bacterium]
MTGSAPAAEPVAVIFVIDGLQPDAAALAMANGANNLRFLHDNGVWVEEAYCPSPAPRLRLPDGSLPWGTSSPPNVAMHTGTHIFESRQMDDIFLAARRAGMRSVFSGGAENYKEFTTADFLYASNAYSDSTTVEHSLRHLRTDGTRLIRLHVQRLRDAWRGPQEKLNPGSRYQQHLLHVDRLLGTVFQALRAAGLWDSTYVIIAGDHGMGMTEQSDHPPSTPTSWQPYMSFFGPGIKRGASIPYAESPDIALLVARFLALGPLHGHADSQVSIRRKGTTGTELTNIFEGQPREVPHPRHIRAFLQSVGWKPSDDYGEYRRAMLKLLGEEPE